jgi:hypothetical protein
MVRGSSSAASAPELPLADGPLARKDRLLRLGRPPQQVHHLRHPRSRHPQQPRRVRVIRVHARLDLPLDGRTPRTAPARDRAGAARRGGRTFKSVERAQRPDCLPCLLKRLLVQRWRTALFCLFYHPLYDQIHVAPPPGLDSPNRFLRLLPLSVSGDGVVHRVHDRFLESGLACWGDSEADFYDRHLR